MANKGQPEKKQPAKKQPNKQPDKLKIIWVCTGNTCRSAMAETILKKAIKERKLTGRFTVSSAGLYARPGEDMSEGAKAALERLGYPARKHRAKLFKPQCLKPGVMVVCMTAGHKARIEGNNIYTVAELTDGGDVGDPYGGDLATYLSVANYLIYAVDDVLSQAQRLYNELNKTGGTI